MRNFGKTGRYFLTLLCLLLLGALPLAATSTNVPAASTGGFGEPSCAQCHSGALNPTGGGVAVSVPGVYAGGATYSLQVLVTDPGAAAWGFQLSARFSNGSQAGAFTASSTVSLRSASANGFPVQYAAQSAAGVQAATSFQFTVNWTAPPDNTGGPVTFSVAGLAANHDGSANGDRTYTSQITSVGSAPLVNAGGVVSAAGFQAPVAIGGLISIFGQHFSPAGTTSAAAFPLPTQLGDTQVFLGGIHCPLIYVSDTQINAQVTVLLSAGTSLLAVLAGGTTSAAQMVAVTDVAPDLFTAVPGGTGPGAILHADYSPVTASHPAGAGETVLIFGTGLGLTNPIVTDGAAAAGKAPCVATVSATIGGKSAPVSYAGLAPGFAGLYQINAQVPAVSGIVDVMVTAGAVTSRPGVTIQVQ